MSCLGIFVLLLVTTVVTVHCGLPTVEQINALKAKGATAIALMTETIRKTKEIQKQKIAQINNYVTKIKSAMYAKKYPYFTIRKNIVIQPAPPKPTTVKPTVKTTVKPVVKPVPITFTKTFYSVFG